MNIVLTGMRGVGKSNISRRLSLFTKWPVLSTDLLIEYENGGKTIQEIMASNGGDWHAFREMEFQVVQKISRFDQVIIDCGGGVVVDLADDGSEIYSSRKVDLLKQNGRIVWLKADIERLAAKVKGDQRRPTLDETRSAEEVMRRRLPFYEQAADLVLDIECKGRRKSARRLYEEIFQQRLPDVSL
jgi:shikimate kinase